MNGRLTTAHAQAAAAERGPVLAHPPGPQAQHEQRSEQEQRVELGRPPRGRSARPRPRVSRAPRPACRAASSATAYRSQLIVAGQRQRRCDGEQRGVPRAPPGVSAVAATAIPAASARPSALMSKYQRARSAASSATGPPWPTATSPPGQHRVLDLLVGLLPDVRDVARRPGRGRSTAAGCRCSRHACRHPARPRRCPGTSPSAPVPRRR